MQLDTCRKISKSLFSIHVQCAHYVCCTHYVQVRVILSTDITIWIMLFTSAHFKCRTHLSQVFYMQYCTFNSSHCFLQYNLLSNYGAKIIYFNKMMFIPSVTKLTGIHDSGWGGRRKQVSTACGTTGIQCT